MKTLVLGGIKSGKSRYAEKLAAEHTERVMVIATAQAADTAMAVRIEHHKANRNPHWRTVEEPLHLQQALQSAQAEPVDTVLIDCLTLWLTNLLLHPDAKLWQRESEAFIAAMQNYPGNLIMVSNENSMGIVPVGELTRRFCDEAGRLHQRLAASCDQVVLLVAGLPQQLKG